MLLAVISEAVLGEVGTACTNDGDCSLRLCGDYVQDLYMSTRYCCSDAAIKSSCSTCEATSGNCVRTWEIVGAIVTGEASSAFGASAALSGDGLHFATLSPSGNSAQVYERIGDAWSQMGQKYLRCTG